MGFTYIYGVLEQIQYTSFFIHFFTFVMIEILSFGSIFLNFFIMYIKKVYKFIMLDMKVCYLLTNFSLLLFFFMYKSYFHKSFILAKSFAKLDF